MQDQMQQPAAEDAVYSEFGVLVGGEAFWTKAREDEFAALMNQRGRYEHASAGVTAGPKETAEYEFSPSEVCPRCFTIVAKTGACGVCD